MLIKFQMQPNNLKIIFIWPKKFPSKTFSEMFIHSKHFYYFATKLHAQLHQVFGYHKTQSGSLINPIIIS